MVRLTLGRRQMLVTSKFVLLNVPKSGSSFVREVIKAIYAGRSRKGPQFLGWTGFQKLIPPNRRTSPDLSLKELILPNIRLKGRPSDQHGTYSQVPREYRHLPVISVVRNPYEKLVSDFEFRWWSKYPPLPDLQRTFPAFPEISFDEFLQLSDLIATYKMGGRNPLQIGNLTVEFVQFFFPDPKSVLNKISDDYICSSDFIKDMPCLWLLRQECLRDDLEATLSGFGFSEEELEICRRHPRVNETVARADDRAAYWTAPRVSRFNHRERFLLLMLQQLGFSYGPPASARCHSKSGPAGIG